MGEVDDFQLDNENESSILYFYFSNCRLQSIRGLRIQFSGWRPVSERMADRVECKIKIMDGAESVLLIDGKDKKYIKPFKI